jgi:carbonic anhydrase
MKQATRSAVVAVAGRSATLAAAAVVLILAGACDGRQLRSHRNVLEDGHVRHPLGTSALQQAAVQAFSRQEPDAPAATYDKWDYSDHGGASWAALGQCGQPGQQSPIDISKTEAILNNSESLYFRFQPYTSPIKMLNSATTHALEATIEGDAGDLAVGSLYPSRLTSQFQLKKIVIHSPSEHTYRGVRVPLELQMHFEGMITAILQPKVAITSIGFYPDGKGSSQFLDSLRSGGLPEEPGDETMVNREAPSNLDFDEIFGPSEHTDKGGFWQYDGSETSPPCAAGILWFVRDEPLPASMEAIEEYRKVITAGATPDSESSERGNYRDMQSAEGRQVKFIEAKDASRWEALEDPKEAQAAAAQAPVTGHLTPAQWDNLVRQAQANQAAANSVAGGSLGNADGLSAEELAARNARQLAEQRAAMANRVLSGATPYEICLRDLASTKTEQQAADEQAKRECKGKDIAHNDLESAGGGLAKLAAAKIYNGQSALCDDAEKVANALKLSVDTQETNCKALAPPPAAPAVGVADLLR